MDDIINDMRKSKRVRFVDGGPVHDSSEKCEATESPRSDAPKTSEFSYFRRLKIGAVHGHSRSVHKENENLKRPKINNLIAESSSAPKPSREDLKSSVSGERAGPSDHNIFLTPSASKYEEPNQRKRTDRGEKRSSLLFDNTKPVGQSSFASPLHGASENSDNEYNEKGIFSAKRHQLRQWAAQTLFSEEAEKGHPKGFDFVTALMSRLFPKDNKNSKNSFKEDADTTCKSLILHESNNLDTSLHLFNKSDWDNDIPKFTSGRSNKFILPERDTLVSGFPFHSYETESPVQELLDQQHPRTRLYNTSPTQNYLSICVPFEKYNKPFSSFRFEGLDDFSSITDRPREKQLHRRLLEWEPSKWEKEDILGSSVFCNEDTENVHVGFPTSWSVDQKQLCSSFSNYFPEFDSFPKSCLTSCLTQDLPSASKCIILGKQTNDVNLLCDHDISLGSSSFYNDDTENVHTGFANSWSAGQKQLCSSFSEYFPEFDSTKDGSTGWLTWDLPSSPKFLVLGEDINNENLLSEQNIIFHHRDQHWPESDSRQKCLSASDFSSEDNYPSIFHARQYPQNNSSSYSPGKPVTRFSESAFFKQNILPSNHHQSSLGAFMNRPFLLDHVRYDRVYQELYFGDEDDELEYK